MVENDPGLCGAEVAFEVTATDNCGDVTVVCDPLSGSMFPVGETTVTCTATDEFDNTADTLFTVTVEDTELPAITAIADPITLWPPNHKYQKFSVETFVVSVSDNCANLSAANVRITEVSSDEPENANGDGDGNTKDDIVISSDCKTVDLRKERQGDGNGRVYTIHLAVDDGNDNIGTALAFVTVPHDQEGSQAVDDGAGFGYSIASECGEALAKFASRDGDSIREAILPEDFALLQNYPNPFNAETKIYFQVPDISQVRLRIFNMIGQEIVVLLEVEIEPGIHQVSWNGKNTVGSDVPSGVYMVSMEAENYNDIMKVMLIR